MSGRQKREKAGKLPAKLRRTKRVTQKQYPLPTKSTLSLKVIDDPEECKKLNRKNIDKSVFYITEMTEALTESFQSKMVISEAFAEPLSEAHSRESLNLFDLFKAASSSIEDDMDGYDGDDDTVVFEDINITTMSEDADDMVVSEDTADRAAFEDEEDDELTAIMGGVPTRSVAPKSRPPSRMAYFSPFYTEKSMKQNSTADPKKGKRRSSSEGSQESFKY